MATGKSLSVRITHRLSNRFALDAAFEASAGFTMVLGPSGGGKTTLLNCIAGFARPDTGCIALGARVLFDSDGRIDMPVAERRLGYVFQNLALFPHLTVAQNVQYGIANLPANERRARMMTMIESFRIAHLLARKPGEISGGERQRVALARSLVMNPAALLLDEPLTALDNATKSKILDDLRAWNTAHEIPILYVTHSPEETFALGERVVVLEGGRILAQGMPQHVLTTPRHETIAQVVGFENVFDATVRSIAETQGTMLCHLDGSATQLEVPLGHAEPGARVRIAIRAGDIIIASDQPHNLSARNSFQGRVLSIRREGVRAVVMIQAGAEFEVHLTPAAIDALRLEAGKQIWLVIKTYSCNLVEPSSR
ncbi:MAG TPA: molybdenum ABC transporter ATP-binding protein [Candidatus Binatus sp.]|uniref:molybdenum ABC transporter ATP-binding protein n=1 Tax=Candidatus Binatus sp. TaxID=2811406 RepID=UPI002B47E352|nr:molybdenum ABC transporter ATP-binding protein [Candidatus Binatus sp.]HKN15093.1 molybdenum ABC transporter ATP-binding protein [Candidatus Binatus sp.]